MPPSQIGGMHFEMLGRHVVGERRSGFPVLAQHDAAVVAPRSPRHVRCRVARVQKALDLCDRRCADRLADGHQRGGAVGTVLGLAQQVIGQQLWVCAVVGNEQHLGRTRQQVDADRAEQLSLGLCHKRVAGAAQQVHRPAESLDAVRHRRKRLNAADGVDLVRARTGHGGQLHGMNAPAGLGGRARDDAFHACDLGDGDRHQCRGDERIHPAGHIAARGTHRDDPVSQAHSAPRRVLQGPDALLLSSRERPNAFQGEINLGDEFRFDSGLRLADFVGADPKRLRIPLVELPAVTAHRVDAAGRDVSQDLADRLGHVDLGILPLGHLEVPPEAGVS